LLTSLPLFYILILPQKSCEKEQRMRLRSIALVVTILLANAVARAQSGVFLTFDAQQFTQEDIYAKPGIHGNVDRPWVFGPGYGIYYDLNKLPKVPKFGKLSKGPVALGIDVRGATLRVSEYGSTLNRQDGIFSLRAAPRNQFMNTTPYLIGGFGIGHTKRPGAANYTNNLIYQFGLGVDRNVRKNIDWRVFEATAGFLGDYVTGTGAHPSNYLVTLRTGVVFRIK
jgi:hypothetical protein